MNEPMFLCRTEELAEGHYREFIVEHDAQSIFLVATRHQGQAKAWLNICPHQGRALNWAPDRFITDDAGRLVCAAHGAVFEPEHGVCVSGPCENASLRGVELVERDDAILINYQA